MNLSLKKLREVLLDVEVILNNRPLRYLEDDVQLQPLTPNKMLHGANISLPEEDLQELEGEPTFKLATNIKRCKGFERETPQIYWAETEHCCFGHSDYQGGRKGQGKLESGSGSTVEQRTRCSSSRGGAEDSNRDIRTIHWNYQGSQDRRNKTMHI